jgi:hypothetical protein
MDMISKEKRSYLRGDVSFKVKFRIVTTEEYETIKNTADQFLSLDKFNPNRHVLDFLLQTEEKLDQILALLSNKEVDNGFLDQGIGLNISGSGMSMLVDQPIEPGKILHTSFLLSRYPITSIKVFGEVVRTTTVNENDKTFYDLGIKFLYLNPDDREKIIACVFQSHRRDLRKRKSETRDSKDS